MVIQRVEQLTPSRLSEILVQDGVLKNGQVAGVETRDRILNRGYVANSVSLDIQYSPDAVGDLPRFLFLKMSKPEMHPEFRSVNQHEVAFYEEIARTGIPLPVARCYSAQADLEGQTHILMKDYSDTHHQMPQPIPPGNQYCEMIVESLARLHATWWNDPRLGNGLGELPTQDEVRSSRARLENTFPLFADFLGEAFLPAQRKILEQILASAFLTQMGERLLNRQNITLVHGDAHTGNLLLPSDPNLHDIILIDWHLWGVYFGANDLAFLMALHWTPQRRAVVERRLLERYYQVLVESGVQDYPFDQFWNDYRRSVMIMTLIPVGQFRRKQNAGAYWYGLQHSTAAFEDLDCWELLDP